MKKLLKRLAATLLVISVVAVAIGYLVLRSSLPPLDGELRVTGLTGAVSVERDTAGIATITATDRNDLAFGTGFVHGQDRFFQMDLTRRKAAGELAELIGAVALPADRRSRLHRFRSRAHAVVAAMTSAERALLRSYVAGVNAGLASLSAKPFEYFILRDQPMPWTIEDSLLVAYAMFIELNDERASRDVRRGYAQRALPDELFDWMYPDGTAWDAPLSGSTRRPDGLPGADIVDLRHTHVALRDVAVDYGDEEPLPGSNNWVVGGALTTDGRAIVANDMHLGITTPNVFYRARLIQEGSAARDVSGVTLPGVPVVVAGSNGRIAWGFTNSYGDWSDAVLLRQGDDAASYLTAEGMRRVVERRERIAVKGAPDEIVVVRETVWGPILDDVEHPDGEIAVSWIAHHAEAINLVQLELETADSVEAAIGVANRMGIPPQNFVVGDAAGNIAWTIAGRIPRRGGAAALSPADWSAGTGWDGWLTPDEYPRLVNPPQGRIWTANARVTDGSDLTVIGDGGYDLGARAKQIRDRLFDRERFAPSDMLGIQLDDRALFLVRWRGLLLELLDDAATRDHPVRSEYRELVRRWLPRASADSVGYRLVRAFRTDVRERVFRMLTEPVRMEFGNEVPLRISNQFEGPLWQLVTERPAHLLAADYPDWRAFLLESVDNNLAYYEANFDGALAERTWGERNTAAIRHPLSRALPLLSAWLDMPPEPLSGDWNMPRVQTPSFGASERFAVSPGAERSGYLHMPAGQSGHPLSRYYRRGHADWVRGQPRRFLPGENRHRLILQPGA